MILRANDIDTLVLFGIATSGVVLSTLLEAADSDFHLAVTKDRCLRQFRGRDRLRLNKRCQFNWSMQHKFQNQLTFKHHPASARENFPRARSRLACPSECAASPPSHTSCQKMARGDLGPIVAANRLRQTTLDCDGSQHTRHSRTGKARVHLQALAGIHIDHAQHPQVLPAGRHIAGEIQRPFLVRRGMQRPRDATSVRAVSSAPVSRSIPAPDTPAARANTTRREESWTRVPRPIRACCIVEIDHAVFTGCR
jgi:hypothetical protein